MTFNHAMLLGPAGEGTEKGVPSTREPSTLLAQNGPFPWIPTGAPRSVDRTATGSRNVYDAIDAVVVDLLAGSALRRDQLELSASSTWIVQRQLRIRGDTPVTAAIRVGGRRIRRDRRRRGRTRRGQQQ